MRIWLKRVVVCLLMGWVGFVAWESRPVQGGVAQQLGLPLVVPNDTVNCVGLYKPYRIVIPPNTDTMITREILKSFANHLDLQFDEVYNRVRDALCNVAATCVEQADTIYPCVVDTLYLMFQGVAIRDTIQDDIGASIKMYEDTSDGGQYAGFVVKRDPGSSDTNNIQNSYFLVMPYDKAASENRNRPGAGYTPGTGIYNHQVTGNSELLCDADGNLYWIDRDYFERVIVDTIIADTVGGSGMIDVFAEEIHFRGDNEDRGLVGEWVGTGINVTEMFFYEAMDNGTLRLVIRPNEQMTGSWDIQWPDTSSRYAAAIWRFPKNATEAPSWVPYDDELVYRGTDTISCNTGSTTINYRSSGTRYSGQPYPEKYHTKYAYFVTVDWVDLIIRTDHTPDDTNFAPPPGARRDSLYVYQELNMDYFDTNAPTLEPSGAYFASDTTFVLKTPLAGCDTVWAIHWMVVGRPQNYEGHGN